MSDINVDAIFLYSVIFMADAGDIDNKYNYYIEQIIGGKNG